MRLLFVCTAILLFTLSTRAQDATRVLFLGNSYTFFNELPVMLTELAASMGHVVVTAENTPGGASLQGHTTNATSQELIEQGNWDFVVLQEQSQKASLPYDEVVADFFPSVESLVETIRLHNDCAVPLLYMTWGRENGDSQNCAWWPPVCTYSGMQELLTERYLEASDNSQSWCAPVGMIWEDILNSTNINLYNADSSHPSAAGSYLAASTFFVALFGENPAASNYSGPISLGASTTIDEAVWNVWQTQSSAWMQYDLMGMELFTQSTSTGCNIQVSTSPYVDSVLVSNGNLEFVWQNGDVESLIFDGSATFDLTVYSQCAAPNFSSETFYSSTASIAPYSTRSNFSIYPNPASDLLFIDVLASTSAEVIMRNSRGKTMGSWSVTGTESINVSGIPQGVYSLEILSDGKILEKQAVLIQR